jgi:hypothetical protein
MEGQPERKKREAFEPNPLSDEESGTFDIFG